MLRGQNNWQTIFTLLWLDPIERMLLMIILVFGLEVGAIVGQHQYFLTRISSTIAWHQELKKDQITLLKQLRLSIRCCDSLPLRKYAVNDCKADFCCVEKSSGTESKLLSCIACRLLLEKKNNNNEYGA